MNTSLLKSNVNKECLAVVFNDSIFEIDKSKNLINLTKIAESFEKTVYDWKRLPNTQRFLEAFFKKTPERENLVVVNGGASGNGTWASKRIALKFAEWISVEFELYCNEKLDELFTNGSTSLVPQFKVPQTFKEALLLAVEQQEKIEQQEQLLIEQKPKVDFYNQVADSTGSFDMREVSAMLKLPYGRNKLFQVLREKEFLMKDNLPYRKYIDSHFFIVVESSWVNAKTEEVNITKQTRITQKGLNFLQKVLTQ